MKQVCKCHGVSGSCSMKICWQVMPDFRIIGENLVKNLNEALQVNIDRQGLKVKRTRSTGLKRKPRKDDLVFVLRSPNFCEKNIKIGSLGTKGRRCVLLPRTILFPTNNNSSIASTTESCSRLCCGRGYRTKVVEIEEDCNCQFQWCCQVKCQKCKKRILEYYCN
jgi:wingless-type MMTV integration site family protein 4